MRKNLQRIVLLVFGTMLLGAAFAQEDLPETTLSPTTATQQGASVVWNSGATAPGTLVRVSLRGVPRNKLFSQSTRWHLVADGKQLPARLVLPEPIAPPLTIDLPIIEHSPVSESDIVIIVDRGEDPEPITMIELKLATVKLKCSATVELSMDNLEYQPPRTHQVVFQEIRDGNILRISKLDCDAGNRRYIRISLLGSSGVSVSKVTGWLDEKKYPPAYKIDAALGPMRESDEPGQHLWPLILESDRLPIIKLKIVGDLPEDVRLIEIVRLDNDQLVRFAEDQLTWASKLSVGNINREEKWVDLPGSISGAPWGLLVHDGDLAPLQLETIMVYATEGWIEFIRPETDAVELWFEPGADPALIQAEFDEKGSAFSGKFENLDLEQQIAQPSEQAAPSPVLLPPQVHSLLQAWWKPAAYAIGALISLMIGTALLRRKTTTNLHG